MGYQIMAFDNQRLYTAHMAAGSLYIDQQPREAVLFHHHRGVGA